MRKKLGLLFTVLIALSLVIAGCGGSDSTSGSSETGDDSWKKVEDRGKLLIGNCPEYPPFSTRNASGQIEGFDVDFAKGIADALGVDFEIINIPWEGLVAELVNDQFDIIISCISPVEAEQAGEAVAFSKPYYNLSEIIIVNADNTDINSKEDLAGKIVGVQDNCSSSKAAETLPDKGIVVKELKRYERNAGAIADLQAGRLDAVIVGEAYAATQAKKNPAFRTIYDPVDTVEIVVVAKQGADELISKINGAIDTVKSNGVFDTASDKWLVTAK